MGAHSRGGRGVHARPRGDTVDWEWHYHPADDYPATEEPRTRVSHARPRQPVPRRRLIFSLTGLAVIIGSSVWVVSGVSSPGRSVDGASTTEEPSFDHADPVPVSSPAPPPPQRQASAPPKDEPSPAPTVTVTVTTTAPGPTVTASPSPAPTVTVSIKVPVPVPQVSTGTPRYVTPSHWHRWP